MIGRLEIWMWIAAPGVLPVILAIAAFLKARRGCGMLFALSAAWYYGWMVASVMAAHPHYSFVGEMLLYTALGLCGMLLTDTVIAVYLFWDALGRRKFAEKSTGE